MKKITFLLKKLKRYSFSLLMLLAFFFTGNVIAQTVSSDKTTLDFGSVDIDKSKSLTFKVTGSNPSNPATPITFTDITIEGTNASDFNQSNNCCAGGYTKVYHGSSPFEFLVYFEPKTAGNKSAVLKLFHDGVGSPLVITLLGGGETPLIPSLTAIPDVNFGAQNFNSVTTKTFTLQNTGNTKLKVTNLIVDNTYKESTEFSIKTPLTFPFEIAEGASMDVSVDFSSTVTSNFNDRKCRILIDSDSNSDSRIGEITTSQVILKANFFTPVLEVDVTSLNFGDVTVGQSETKNIVVTNSGLETLVLPNPTKSVRGGTDFTTDYQITSPTTFPVNILPGQTQTLQVTFTPSGLETRPATINVKSENHSPIFYYNKQISVDGKGVDKVISNLPTSYNFGSLRLGNTLSNTFTINAIGGLNVNITNIEITGANASEFSLIGNTTRTVVPGTATQIEIKHTPASIGAKTANLVITSEDKNSPHTIVVNSNIINSDLKLSATTLDLGETIITNTSTNKLVTLSNATGTDAVTISNISLSGTNTSDFNLVGVTLPITINAGAETSFNVNFAPTVSGTKTAQIDIVSNDDNSPQIVSLTAKGLAPKLNLSTSLLKFLETEANAQTRTKNFNIVNIGTSDLTINSITSSGVNASDFNIAGTSFPITIAPLTSKTINVNFSPTTEGMKGAKLIIQSSLAGNIELPMLGTSITPKLTFAGATNFGNVNVKVTKTNTITLNNVGSNTLRVSAINLQGTNAAIFSLGAITFPLEIKKGESLELPISLKPDTGGAKNATLEVISNDLSSPNSLTINANITTLPIFSAQTTPFKLNEVPNGKNFSYTKYPITNTGASDLILYGNKGIIPLQIDGAGIFIFPSAIINSSFPEVPQAERVLNDFPVTIPPGQTKNILIIFRKSASTKPSSYARLGIETNLTSSGSLCQNAAIGCSNTWINEMQFTAGRDVPGFSLATTDAIEFPDTSIGRSSKETFKVTNTGNTDLNIFTLSSDNLGMFRIKGEDSSSAGDNHFSIIVTPGETRTFNVQFRPTGAEDRKNENLILRTNVPDPSKFDGTKLSYSVPVTGLAVEPEDVEVNGLIFQADSKVVNGDFVTLKGNVHIGNLEFSNDVLVNLKTNEVKCDDCEMFATNIPKVGGFGGEKVLLQSGNITTEVVITEAGFPELDMTKLVSTVSNRLLKLAFIPLEITKIKILGDSEDDDDLLSDGIEIGGTVTLPPSVFGEDAQIEIKTIRISTITGLDIIGNVEINPELNVLGIFTLNNAEVNFDTTKDTFGGSAEIGFELMGKGVTIGAGLQIIKGGLDSVSLEIEVSPGIPIASTGFQLSGGNGFVEGIVERPITIGLGVDISPVAPLDEVIYFDNMQLSYTFGTSFNAEGTIRLFGENVGGGGVKVYANPKQQGVELDVWADIYDIFKGKVNLLAENKIDDLGKNNFNFEMEAELTVQIPEIPDNVPVPLVLGSINNFLPIVIAEAEVSMDTESMKADVTVIEILEVNVEVKANDAGTGTTSTFGGNFLGFPFSFAKAAEKRGIKELVFENNTRARPLDKTAGQSLIITPNNPYKKQSKKAGFTDVPFTLSQSYSNIVVRATGTTAIPNFTLILPDGTELTSDNASAKGALYTTYDKINGGHYILKNTPIGDYIMRLEDSSDTYKLDVAGAEFAPNISNIAAVQNTTTNDITITWNDQDLDSDAKVSFYYDIDDKNGNGFIIEKGISENDATDQITWNADFLQNGTYHIYGKIDDGTHTPKIVYSSDTFTINKKSMVTVPTLVSDKFKEVIELSWSEVENVHHYRVYIDEEDVTLYSFNQNVGKDTSFDFTKILPGRTYKFGVTAVLKNGTELVESNLSNIETVNFISTVENNIPKIMTTSLPDRNTVCDSYTTNITAVDPDASDALLYTLEIAPAGLTMSSNGNITWTPNKDQKGKHQVKVKVDDQKGGTDTKSFTITVYKVDNIKPIADNANLTDITSECSVTVTSIPTANDACSGALTATTKDPLTYTTQGTHTINWNFDDGNGNILTQQQKVIIKDTTIPTVTTQNVTVELNASGTATISTTDIENGSSDTCGINAMTLDKTSFNCSNIGDNTVTLSVTDVNGNTATKTAIVSVVDKIAPTVITQDITVNLDTTGKVSIVADDINNGSTDNCSIATITLSQTEFDDSNTGENTVTLTVKDTFGNTSSKTATVTVKNPHLSVDDNELAKNLFLYPNPTKRIVTIRNDKLQIQKVEIFNINGKKLFEKTYGSTKIEINLTNYSKGVYLIKVYSKKGVVSKQLIKK